MLPPASWLLERALGAPLRWGLGVMLGGPVSLFGLDTDEAFGQLGFTNILGWADPERRPGVAGRAPSVTGKVTHCRGAVTNFRIYG